MDLYISPHPDDAILSCGGRLIKEDGPKTILNIFSGNYKGETGWDKLCGLKGEPMKTRIKEDKKQLKKVGVVGIYLDFYDQAAYDDIFKKEPPTDRRDQVGKKIREVIATLSPRRVFCPYGIGHPDHKLVSRAVKSISKNPVFYEDFPYSMKKSLSGGKVFKFSRGILDKKMDLILGYESQLKGFFELTETKTVEEFISKTKEHHLRSGNIGESYLIEK